MKTHFLLKTGFIALTLVLLVSTVQAGTKTSTGSANWGNANTWTPSGVPSSGDDVIIAPGHMVTVNITAECNTLTINAAAVSGGITISGTNTLSVTGAITFSGTVANAHLTFTGA